MMRALYNPDVEIETLR